MEERLVLIQKLRNDSYLAVLKDEYRYDGSSVIEAKTMSELTYKVNNAERVDDRWVTMNGAHVLIGGSGKIVGGAGGKFNGMTFGAKFKDYGIGRRVQKGKYAGKIMVRPHPTKTGSKPENLAAFAQNPDRRSVKQMERRIELRKAPKFALKKNRTNTNRRLKQGRRSSYGETNVADADKKFIGMGLNGLIKGDLLSKHIDSRTGKLTPERNALHVRVVQEHLRGVKPASGQPTMTFLGGGSAAGKSTYVKNAKDFPSKKTAVHVDSDNIKGKLPEYNQMVKAGLRSAAGYAHEESSALAKRVISVAQNRGYNVVLDGTGDNSPASMSKKIAQARSHGMRVNAVYVTVPTKVALERANKRGEKTGRVIDENVIRNIHKSVSKTALAVADQFDDFKLYDTQGKTPILIASCKRGEKITVHNQELFNDFQSKVNE